MKAYRDILLNSQEFQCVGIDDTTASSAASLRARYQLKTPDALDVATAIEMGCDAFLTNDAGIKRVTELHVLILNEIELDPDPEADDSSFVNSV